MDIENITKKVKKLGRDTVEEVQKMNEIRQLKGRISAANKQINGKYMEIGRKFFELNSASAPEGFEEYIQAINDAQELIGQLKEQIRAVKGVVLCPSCNMEVPIGERFCSNCGSRMPEVARVENGETEEDTVVEADMAEGTEETAAEAETEESEDVDEAPAADAEAEESEDADAVPAADAEAETSETTEEEGSAE